MNLSLWDMLVRTIGVVIKKSMLGYIFTPRWRSYIVKKLQTDYNCIIDNAG
jgi:hypothetical protein